MLSESRIIFDSDPWIVRPGAVRSRPHVLGADAEEGARAPLLGGPCSGQGALQRGEGGGGLQGHGSNAEARSGSSRGDMGFGRGCSLRR